MVIEKGGAGQLPLGVRSGANIDGHKLLAIRSGSLTTVAEIKAVVACVKQLATLARIATHSVHDRCSI